MKSKILPETQKLIELFNSMRADIQIEFRKYINDTEPLLVWDVESLNDWNIEADKLEWDLEDFSLDFEPEKP